MPSTGSLDLLPAQYDDGVLIAHPAKIMRFLDTSVMVQRSTIDGKVLVTIDGDDRDIRIILNDGHVWNGPDTTPGPPPRTPNIADSPQAIAAHLAGLGGAGTERGARTSRIHLSPVGDGFWTRLQLVTRRVDREFVTTLTLDHHRQPPYGEEATRELVGASFNVRSEDAAGQIEASQLADAHARGAAILVAYPEAIASLLERNAQ